MGAAMVNLSALVISPPGGRGSPRAGRSGTGMGTGVLPNTVTGAGMGMRPWTVTWTGNTTGLELGQHYSASNTSMASQAWPNVSGRCLDDVAA